MLPLSIQIILGAVSGYVVIGFDLRERATNEKINTAKLTIAGGISCE